MVCFSASRGTDRIDGYILGLLGPRGFSVDLDLKRCGRAGFRWYCSVMDYHSPHVGTRVGVFGELCLGSRNVSALQRRGAVENILS
jgi:hypothetical protein